MVIPHSPRPAVLTLSHEGHQGINRTKALARESIWWPGISADITSLVTNCEQCASTRVNHAEPLVSTVLPGRPWELVGVDLFHLRSQTFILVVDYHSRYPEVVTLRSNRGSGSHRRSRKHLCPAWDSARSQIRQRSTVLFTRVCSIGGILRLRPRHQQPALCAIERRGGENGQDNQGVVSQSTDPHLALLSYRDTPGVDGFSPAQLLMGRQLRTKVPKQDSQLCPHWPSRKDVRRKDAAYKQKQAADFNRHHRAQDLSSLRLGQCVWVRPDQVKATVLSPARLPRSYVVETEQGGVLQRNRRHLVPFAPPAPRVEPPPSEEQEPQRTLPPLEPQRTTTVQPPDSLGLPPADSDRSDGVTRTRSGRRVMPPNRLNL
ncbi:uncharacterized protein LOC142768278 [Rhipicephalus microplus]|uniref:uncharacterized protein LOC142768278 n=1 Tax=Rhipicephalus microplus TaxID=6941 RepID=UPI003F6C41B5